MPMALVHPVAQDVQGGSIPTAAKPQHAARVRGGSIRQEQLLRVPRVLLASSHQVWQSFVQTQPALLGRLHHFLVPQTQEAFAETAQLAISHLV
jgi:hypothetical protein